MDLEKEVSKDKIAKFGKIESHKELRYEILVPQKETAKTSAQMLKELPIADISINPPEADDVIREVFTRGIKK